MANNYAIHVHAIKTCYNHFAHVDTEHSIIIYIHVALILCYYMYIECNITTHLTQRTLIVIRLIEH